MMNQDIFRGKWQQMQGQMREWWGELTDDDVEQIAGHYDKMVGTLQERYGYSRERAEQEIQRRMGEFEAHGRGMSQEPR